MLAFVVLITALAGYLVQTLPAEYAPSEDRGAFFISLRAPEGATLEATDRSTRQVEDILKSEVGEGKPVKRYLTRLPGWNSSAVNGSIVIVLLSHWDSREETDKEISGRLRKQLAAIPGARVFSRTPRALGIRGSGTPIQLVLGGPDYKQLKEWRDKMLVAMESMPELANTDSDFQERKPQMKISVDRNRAAMLGVSLSNVGRTLETMLGSRTVTTYVDRGREYNVVLMGSDADRSSTDDLTNLYVRSSLTNDLVPLSNLVNISEVAGPSELKRFDRMRSITVSADLSEGTSLGEAIEKLIEVAGQTLPASTRLSWNGESEEYLSSGSSLYLTFGMALLIVFLVLAAQFESFVNPMIILVTVPLALTGALLGLWAYGSSLNVFSQIGAILLIGLSAKMAC